MSNEVVEVKQQTEVAELVDYKAVAIEYLKNLGLNLPENQASQFIEMAKAFNLNPFKREIYAVKYNDKFNIITGYEVYLKRAERTGKLNGCDFKLGKDEYGKKGIITIYRKDWTYPFVHEVYYKECAQNGPLWQKMPNFMLKKVAIAQGFRLCFPDEFGGMPYTSDEMPADDEISLNPDYQEKEHTSANQLLQEAKQQEQESIIKQSDVIDVKTEAPKVENQPKEIDNNVIILEQLYSTYEKNIHPKYHGLIEQTIQTGSASEVLDIITRIKNHLAFQGIKVA